MTWEEASDDRGLYFRNESYSWEPEEKLPVIISDVISLFKTKLIGKGHDSESSKLNDFGIEVNCNSGRLFFTISNESKIEDEEDILEQGCEVVFYYLQQFLDSIAGLLDSDTDLWNKKVTSKVIEIGKTILYMLREDGSFKSMNFICYGEEEDPEFQETI
jgi:hypothetical protein